MFLAIRFFKKKVGQFQTHHFTSESARHLFFSGPSVEVCVSVGVYHEQIEIKRPRRTTRSLNMGMLPVKTAN